MSPAQKPSLCEGWLSGTCYRLESDGRVSFWNEKFGFQTTVTALANLVEQFKKHLPPQSAVTQP